MASMRADEIIKEIGGCGRFQIILGIVMHTIKFSTVWSMFTMVFAAATPKWWCYDDVYGDAMPILNTTDGYLNVSNMNYSNHVEPLYKSCTNRNGGACKHIVYDYNMRTIFNEWELACSNEWIPSMIASIQMAGLFLGHFVSGHLADRFGRKVPLMLSLILMLIANIAAFFADSWIFLAVARAIIGCGMAFYLTIQYTLVAEVSPLQWRSLNINSPSWAIQLSLFALLSYCVPNWRTLSLISGLTCVPFMVTWFFIPESFRWYLAQDKHAEAKKVICRIARYNGKSPPREMTLENHLIKGDDSAKKDDKHYSVVDLFRHRALLKTTVISILNWFSLGITGYGISFGLQALSGSFFLNLFMFSAIEILPKLSLSFFSNRFGRKRTSIAIFTLIAVSSLAVGIVQYIDMDQELRGQLTFAFALLCKTCNGMSWGAVQTITLEVYPTVVRNIGYGFLNMCARVGAIIAPQFAFLDTQIVGFMYFFISGIATLCATGTAFLRETNRLDLVDKI